MKRNYLKKSTFVAAIITQLLLCFSATSYAASFGTNLVFNGDAEQGYITGWTAIGPNVSAFVVADAYFGEQVQAKHGKVLELYDGSANIDATFLQTISIADFQSSVATGLVSLNFSAQAFSWFGATVSYTVEELGASDNVLSTHTSGSISLFGQSVNYHTTDSSACTWTTTSIAVTRLNIGTSKLRISVHGKTSATYEDFLDFDNIQLVLSSVPSVTTTSVTNFDKNSAIMGGNVTAENGAPVTGRGVVYSTTDATPTIGEPGVTMDANGSGTSSFSESITGLSCNTVYYVRAYATNTVGTSYGNVVIFKTLAVVPTIATTTVTAVTATTATLNGTCNPNNSAAISWFRYATSSPGAINDSFGTRAPASGGFSMGSGTSSVSYSLQITGLMPGTTYYYGAIAYNEAGTVYGTVMSFTTQAIPDVTWSNPADITYGTLLSATQLNAAADVPGTFTYTPALGTKLDAGTAQNLKVDFTPNDAVNYTTASKTVTINVAKATPVITWSNPADISNETALSNTQLNAGADISGTFTYTPAAGVQLNVGNSQVLKVDFVPSDLINYEFVSKTVLINVFLATGKTEVRNNEFIALYPNPVMDAFNVPGIDGRATISITDLNGKTVLTKVISPDEKVSVSNLSSGIYLVKITTNNGIALKKMVKK